MLPFFTSLFLLGGKRREVRFFALQCAFIDVFAIMIVLATSIPGAIYFRNQVWGPAHT